MNDIIIKILNEIGIANYTIFINEVDSVELFFIKKKLDMRRRKSVKTYEVTVYKDFERDGEQVRGFADAVITPSMNYEEVYTLIKDAYFSAGFAANPYFMLHKGKKEEMVIPESRLMEFSLEEAALKMSEAMYSNDTSKVTFINSSEIFATEKTSQILNSEGINVSYKERYVKGEFVVQCKHDDVDVETYHSFGYADLETEALKEKVLDAFEMTHLRGEAKLTPKSGNYDIVVSGRDVSEIFSYYFSKSNAGNIYMKYSDYEVGKKVQGEDVKGDLLNIEAVSKVPYSFEGVKMSNRALIKDGKVEFIQGNVRFSYYLGIEPTGSYGSMKVKEGKKEIKELTKDRCLHIVSFSDFSMDTLSGYYAGEIRLAFLHDGENVIPVTGGSINGKLQDAHNDLELSKEIIIELEYEGPKAIKLKNVSVSGI